MADNRLPAVRYSRCHRAIPCRIPAWPESFAIEKTRQKFVYFRASSWMPAKIRERHRIFPGDQLPSTVHGQCTGHWYPGHEVHIALNALAPICMYAFASVKVLPRADHVKRRNAPARRRCPFHQRIQHLRQDGIKQIATRKSGVRSNV